MNTITDYKRHLDTLSATVENIEIVEADFDGEQLFKITLSNTDELLKTMGVNADRTIDVVMGRITIDDECEFIIHFNYIDYLEDEELEALQDKMGKLNVEEEADFNDHKIIGFWNETEWHLTYTASDD